MSEYSILLRKYIDEKNVKVVQLIQYCEMERSTVYKIINGKRKPASLEIAKKIANFMQLSPTECESYYEAYYKTVLGEEKYNQNQQIQKLIHNFSQIIQGPVFMEMTEHKVEAVDEMMLHLLRGKIEIDYHIKMLLEEELQNEKPKVRLIAQCENAYLIQTLRALGRNRDDLSIQHMMCFQRQGEDSRQNLELIQKIMGFYACRCHYEPYYYYDEVTSHFHNMNLFCNCIICEEGVLCYTSDYMYGQLIRDKECIEAYQQLFEQYLQATYPLMTKMDSVVREYMSVGQMVLKCLNTMSYSLQAEPCVVPFVTEEMLRSQIREEMPSREQMVIIFGRYIAELRQAVDMGKCRSYFTIDGTEDFILNGKIGEIPDNFYHPLKKEDCLEILKNMLPYFADGKYRLLKNQLANIQSNLHIFVAASAGHFLFSNSQRELVYIAMNEPKMIQQFYDFMESLNEEMSLYTTEEAVEKITALIEKYQ